MSGPYITATTLTRHSPGAEAPDVYKKEIKKMNFLQRWFDRMCREAWERAQNTSANPVRIMHIDEPHINVDGMSIRLSGATGGHIVEFCKYDKHKDRNDRKLYVIPTEKNFTESFSKIVGMEMMR